MTRHIFLCLVIISLIHNRVNAQKCATCEPLKVAGFSFDVQVPQPENKELWSDWQAFRLADHVTGQLGHSEPGCLKNTIPPTYDKDDQQLFKFGPGYANLPSNPDINQNLSVYGDYLFTGTIKQVGDNYVAHAEIQTSCSRKTVASADVSFPISQVTGYAPGIAGRLVSQLSPLSNKIAEFEKKERASNPKVAFRSMEEEILIVPKKRNLGMGEQTELEITMKDCDGQPLGNREIVFTKGATNDFDLRGTMGGTVSPAKVVTDANGKAKATFKMGSTTSAMINAHHIHNTPTGCEFAKMGSTPIGGIPVKVDLSYWQEESKTIKRATLPSIDIKGGDETEKKVIEHSLILYHYPSPEDVKSGNWLDIEKEKEKTSRTEYIIDGGMLSYTKKVDDAFITSKVGNVQMVNEIEKGSTDSYNAYSTKKYSSELMFLKGDENNPPQFIWNVLYTIKGQEDTQVGAGATISKGDSGVTWKVKNITDPNSPYKTEYFIEMELDAANELLKGNKAMKELFGFDTNGMAKAIDPTKPKDQMVTATGIEKVTVHILSPFPEVIK